MKPSLPPAKPPHPSPESLSDSASVKLSTKSEKPKAHFSALLLLFGALIAGIIWLIIEMTPTTSKQEEGLLEAIKIKEAKIKETQEIPEKLRQISLCIQGYLSATNTDEMLSFVRFPDKVKPLILKYYRSRPLPHLDFESIDSSRPFLKGNTRFVYVRSKVKQNGFFESFLEEMEDGSFRLDWEYDVSYQPIAWEKFCNNRPVVPMEMRVIVSPDNYYAFHFRDSSKYQCYKLTSKHSDRYLFAYVKRSSPEAKQLQKIFSQQDIKNTKSYTTATQVTADFIDPASTKNPLLKFQPIKVNSPSSPKIKPTLMILQIHFLRNDDSKNAVVIKSIISDNWLYESTKN